MFAPTAVTLGAMRCRYPNGGDEYIRMPSTEQLIQPLTCRYTFNRYARADAPGWSYAQPRSNITPEGFKANGIPPKVSACQRGTWGMTSHVAKHERCQIAAKITRYPTRIA